MGDGHGSLRSRAIVPHLQIPSIGMHLAILIQYGILVGIVSGPSVHQFGNEGRLAGKAGTRKDQRTALTPHHTGMQEDAVRGIVGDVNHQVARKPIEDRLQLCAFRDDLAVRQQSIANTVPTPHNGERFSVRAGMHGRLSAEGRSLQHPRKQGAGVRGQPKPDSE